MKTFQIYRHPFFGLKTVKVGFSWPVFFFGMIWMLVCKLWGKAGLWFCFYLITGIVEATTDTASDEVLQATVYFILVMGYFALWLVPAFKGNAWRVSNLQSRGYELVNTVQATTKDAAIGDASNKSQARAPQKTSFAQFFEMPISC